MLWKRFGSLRSGFVVLLPLLWGCEDAETGPLASVVAEETQGALALQGTILDADGLARRSGSDDPAGLSEWRASWSLDIGSGRAARASAYRVLAPALAGRLSESAIRDALVSLEDALDSSETIPEGELPERITNQLALARDAQLRGALAFEQGDLTRAVTEVLRGSDALREVEPAQVVHQLLTAADEGMRRLLGSESYSEETRQRAESLLKIANDALRNDDYARAIRSAYYATLLLEVDLL
jgi:hypothetical protein